VNTAIAITSFVTVAAFAAAAVISLVLLVRRPPTHSPMPYIAFAMAMTLYALVAASNFFQYSGITEYFDLYEDYAELLFAPLLVLAAYGVEAQSTIDERSRSAALVQQQVDLLMAVIDTSPVGIMIVAQGGHVTFANDPARNLLHLEEDPSTGLIRHAAWTMTDVTGAPTSLGDLVGREPTHGARRLVTWPGGRSQQFLFNATPMNDSDASLGGAVVAVESTHDG
jgi:PAS domain-containing protein